ncbi:hypothetical protein [Rheinheimera sp. 1928-s]|uniref:hypothetical protein n=1 Tax=Rheinheimera sp. 1928-s TaxID=3033803 RepID=UPI00261AC0C4|nr:hypothetical protein [Rheinheimera sp. 1928-s]MDF3123916.1 hypothetical protein [Rheinheimera sp. 1928-s]
MKLIKFIAAAALIASTSLVSGANPAPVSVAPDTIAACMNWPFCRDVEISEQTTEVKQYIAYCMNWPFCRDVEVTDQVLPQQLQTETVRKAA